MFSNATLPEIPIPSQKPQEIRTKNAHNNLADDDLKVGQTLSLDSTFFSRISPFFAKNTIFRFLHYDES